MKPTHDKLKLVFAALIISTSEQYFSLHEAVSTNNSSTSIKSNFVSKINQKQIQNELVKLHL